MRFVGLDVAQPQIWIICVCFCFGCMFKTHVVEATNLG